MKLTSTKNIRTAIVSTLRDTEGVLASFIQYHLNLGFDHLFLFFDDPQEKIPEYVIAHPNISVYPRDLQLELMWETTSVFLSPSVSRNIENDFIPRQLLNAEIALREAFRLDIDWLLHIDIDELFYAGPMSAPEHFASLQDQGIDCVRYPNLEGIPEKAEIENYFQEVSLFKISPFIERNKARIRDVGPSLQHIPQIPPTFFHFYKIGKAAVRVTPSSLPKGPHNFTIPTGGKRIIMDDGPVVLHYPCCGIRHFMQKYKTLGDFVDKWFNNVPIDLSSHLASRDVFATGDMQQIAQFYEAKFVVSNENHVADLLNSGLCVYMPEPAVTMKELHT